VYDVRGLEPDPGWDGCQFRVVGFHFHPRTYFSNRQDLKVRKIDNTTRKRKKVKGATV